MRRLLIASAGIGFLLAATLLLNRAAPGQWSLGASGVPAPVPASPLDILLLAGIGVALFGWALSDGAAAAAPLRLGSLGPAMPRRARLRAAGRLSLALAAGLSAVTALRFTTPTPASRAWLLHGAALLCLLAGTLLVACAHGQATLPIRGKWKSHLWLALLTCAALGLRLTRNDAFPAGIWYDEAMNALVARRLLGLEGEWPLYLAETFHTVHFNLLVAGAFRLFGEEIAAARAVSATMGALLVPATWLTARELFRRVEPLCAAGVNATDNAGEAVAWLAALLVACAAWSLNLSRIAVNYNATPLFAMAATGLLLLGLRTQRSWAYAGAGLALGLGLNFYSSFRLFLPVLPLFLIAALFAQRHVEGGMAGAWARSRRGLAILAIAAIVVSAPLLGFAAANWTQVLERSRETFIFNNVAPGDRLGLLWQSLRAHLLMFNGPGDPNGRHNLPGRPMLDPLLGAFFLAGLALTIRRAREPRGLLLLLWLGCTLLGGVLTLAFEAPQSLRANGALPAALLISLVPVAALGRLWVRAAPRAGTRPYLVVAVLLASPSLLWNLWGYFQIQRTDFAVWNAFSAPETAMARTLATLNPALTDAWVTVDSANHPTVEWLAPHWHGRGRLLLATDPMPMPWRSGRDAWIFLNAENGAQHERLRLLYPQAPATEVRPPFAAAVTATQTHLRVADIESQRGLTFSLARGPFEEEWFATPSRFDALPITLVERVTTINADWPTQPPLLPTPGDEPFVAQWSGALRTSFGPHTFTLEAPARAALYLDETLVLSATDGPMTATVALADGPHALRLLAEGAPGSLSLRWLPPPAPDSGIARIPPAVPLPATPMPIPAEAMFGDPAAAAGLLGRFVPLPQGNDALPLLEAAQDAVDAAPPLGAYAAVSPEVSAVFHIAPVLPPVAVEWRGQLWAPVAGDYLFAATAADALRLTIDGRPVLETEKRNTTSEATLTLAGGFHAIEVLFASRGPHVRVRLEWAPPGRERTSLPGRLLVPPQGDPAAAQERFTRVNQWLFAPPSEFEAAPAQPVPVALTPELLADGLAQPVSLAVGPDGRIHVAELAAGRVRVFAPNGADLGVLSTGGDPLEEPSALALTPEGDLLVLDAARALLLRFAAEGGTVSRLPVQAPYLSRSRGLATGADSRIWVAATATGRIVLLSPEGNVLREWPAAAGADVQPVSLLARPAPGEERGPASVLAAVLGVNVGMLYDDAGSALAQWSLSPANSLEAPRLAPAPGGSFYLTVPEEGEIEWRGADGRLLALWQLPRSPLLKPVGIAVAPDGSLLITDTAGGALWRVVLP